MCRLAIENDVLRVEVAQTGGSLTSVFDKERDQELLWQGSPESWRFQDVVIFPLIGNPSGGYEVDGKTYTFQMPHGVARWETFRVEEHSAERLVLRLESNEETLSRYPFRFCLRLIYQLEGKKYTLTYAVSHTEDRPMPYQVGAHAGFQTAGKTVRVDFDQDTPLYHLAFDGLLHRPAQQLSPNGTLELSKAVYDEKRSLVLERPCAGCTVTREDGVKLRYQWDNAPYVTIWGFSGEGEFLCVEPWWGVCEGEGTPRELAKKEEMCFAGIDERRHTYSCEIL